jgi:hypothetical protein
MLKIIIFSYASVLIKRNRFRNWHAITIGIMHALLVGSVCRPWLYGGIICRGSQKVLGGLRIVTRIICVVCSGTRKLGVVVIRVGERSLGFSEHQMICLKANFTICMMIAYLAWPAIGHATFWLCQSSRSIFFSFISPKRKIDERT